MTKSKEVTKRVALFYLLIGLIILFCGPAGFAYAIDSSTQNIFEGSWTLLEEKQDCNGDSSQVNQIIIEQKDEQIYLTFFEGLNPLKCSIVDNELKCSGRIIFEDGGYLSVSKAIFAINDDQNLEGYSEWVLYDEKQNACKGVSIFSPVPSDLYYQGNWEITEALTGCNLDGYVDTNLATIIQKGGEAAISINGEIFDCTVIVGSGLHCSGEIVLEDGIIMDYFQSIFWFHGDDYLKGSADWAMYSGTTPLCYGSSVTSAVRLDYDVSDSSSTFDSLE